MTSKNLAQMLGLEPGTEISNAASVFLEQVKEYMSSAQASPSEAHAKAEEGALNMLYKNFFEYALEWAGEERKKTVEQPNHPNAKDLKKKATEALNDLQDNIIKFALAYMRLNRSMGFVQDELNTYEKAAGGKGKNIKWTSETGTLLLRYRKERKALKESNARLVQGMKVLEKEEKRLALLEKSMKKIFGGKFEDYLRPYRSALRSGSFDKAEKSLKAMANAKRKFSLDKKSEEAALKTIQKEGGAYINVLKNAQDNLRAQDGKLFFKAREISVTIAAQDKEIEQKNMYINKYYQPYMEHKLNSLRHLKEKLLVVGSLESLTTLYIRLMRGMAQPLADIKAVREYEEEVIGHVYYLLGGQFRETDSIERWNVESMQEFENSLQDFKELA
ncbi:MAG: hypothetical protein DHS20C02_15530 [Micavibrio sp.]|nr:MAG: hypothetical protein DHS20C02_15530 [Micavibrio sp.]